MIKVCALSDMHGQLIDIEPCDLVLVCGDSVSLKMQRYDESTLEWYKNIFKPWAEKLPCKKVLWIAGNHDYMQGKAEEYRMIFSRIDKVTYLEDEGYIYNQDDQILKIWGTPWCRKFGTWHFMAKPEVLKEKFSLIPENLDILMTHDAPYGCSDVLLDKSVFWWTPNHIGNPQLAEAIKEKKPRYLVHGHLHSTNRDFETMENTKVINVSILGEDYKIESKPLYIEL